MPEQIVSPLPEGSARVIDVREHFFLQDGVNSVNAALRGGERYVWYTVGGNWALNGDGVTTTIYNGGAVHRKRAGYQCIDFRIPLMTQRPAFKQWRTGLYVVESLVAWPNNNLAATDTGLLFSFAGGNRPMFAAEQGIELVNDGGAVNLVWRGPGGLETTATGLNPQSLNKFRAEFRQPTSDADGSVRFFANDNAVPIYSKSTADANMLTAAGANIGITTYFGTMSNVEYFYFRDLAFWAGPDTALGM